MMRRGAAKSKGKSAGEARGSRSVEGEPSGEAGLMVRRGAAMDAEEEAARICSVDGLAPVGAAVGRKAGKGRQAKSSYTKLIAARRSLVGEKAPVAAASAAKAAAAAVAEGDKDAADVVAAGVVEGAVAAQGAAVEERAPGRRIKMPQETVDWILSWKRQVFEQEDPDEYYNRMMNDPDRHEVYTQEFLEEERHLMRSMALQFERSADRMEKFQRWVRHELETKGCVEVDDVYLSQRILYRQRFKKVHDDMMRVPGYIYQYNEEIHGRQEVPVESN